MPLTQRRTFALGLIVALSLQHVLAWASDPITGKYASETRENFGSDKPGEYQIEIVRKGSKYALSLSKDGGSMGQIEVSPCSADREGYLQEHPPGEVQVLCDSKGNSVFVYSSGGIKVPVIGKIHKAKYYAHVQWRIYGFRKLQ